MPLNSLPEGKLMTTCNVNEWVAIMGREDATNVSAEKAAANVILKHLIGYRPNTNPVNRRVDIENLANALEAYAKMLQQAGVTVV